MVSFMIVGIYTQVLTNSEGCDSTITLDLTIETSVGLNEINEEIFLYPNPTTDKLVVNVTTVNRLKSVRL